jgi:hypothetical protein
VARIVNLDEILGEDIVFVCREKEYVFPIDVSTGLVWKLADLYEKLTGIETRIAEKQKAVEPVDEEQAAYRTLVAETEQALLEGLRDRDPSLESLPFGARGFQLVLATVLVQLGFLTEETKNPPKGSETMAIPRSRKKKSPPSSSSRT